MGNFSTTAYGELINYFVVAKLAELNLHALYCLDCFSYLQNTNLAPVLVVAASSSNSISVYNVVETSFGAVTK